MAQMIQFMSDTGEKQYPATSSEAVGMSDGSGNLDAKLAELENKTNTIQDNLKYDETPTLGSNNLVNSGNIKKALDSQKDEVDAAKELALESIKENEQSAITNFNAQRVTPEMLSESTKQLIEASGGGNIKNLADDEDITSVDDGTGSNVLKLADRTYNAENFIGKGYKILRKNIVDGKNVLTQDMINENNTIYEVRYDFDLNNKYITLGENSDLFINGGSIKGGIVVCRNSRISNFKAIESVRGICLDYNTGKETTIYGDIINRNVILAANVNLAWNIIDELGMSKRLLGIQKVGINDIIVVLKTKIVDNEFVLRDNSDKKIDYFKNLINGGVRIKMLKFHQPEDDEYKWLKKPSEDERETALEYAVKFKDYVLSNVKELREYADFEYVGISNETDYWETDTEFATILSELAKELINLGYKVLCSRNTVSTIPEILSKQLYMYGINNYGSLSDRDEQSEYNQDMYLGFTKISKNLLYSVQNPIIFITECGALAYDKALRSASVWDTSILGSKNYNIPVVYYKAMKDYIDNNKVYCVSDYWFEGATYYEEFNIENTLNKELYNILLNL